VLGRVPTRSGRKRRERSGRAIHRADAVRSRVASLMPGKPIRSRDGG
jgi:hypothetical protein